jgi:hypothetical protein
MLFKIFIGVGSVDDINFARLKKTRPEGREMPLSMEFEDLWFAGKNPKEP